MAKLTLNSALHGIRGRIDNWVYRKLGDRLVLSRRPEFTGTPSPAQQAVRDRFTAAAAYARAVFADPVRLAPYQTAARAKGLSVFAFVMGDFLNPPEVDAIDASGYHGQVGDPIHVMARDGFSVAAVHVVLRDAANAVLEQGAAMPAAGRWSYVATTAVPAGQTVTIEATATDLPGHTGGKTLPWLVS